ncbi:hypothetical protein SteCoe_4307 [Stentor coeruleus]|uniref:Cyclic nucleotide-binding domain-containing protein n=1 Tax=Stentor coeruleus TaxID=5963 RepID=A0A1R2CV13_9CILI|nr:hypothetical protein SteCoe_4307 [Stentor coeruleus]
MLNITRLSLNIISAKDDLDKTAYPDTRIKDLWKKLRLFSRIIGRFLKIKKDILSYGSKSPNQNRKIGIDSSKYKTSHNTKFLILPESKVKILWEFFMSMAYFYASIFIPLDLTFEELSSGIWAKFIFATDALFFMDLLLAFNTAIILKNREIVTERKEIALRYLKTWFALDLISCFPFEIVAYITSMRSNSYNNFFRIIRFARIYRISKLLKLLKRFRPSLNSIKVSSSDSLKNAIVNFVYFWFIFMLSVHIFGCIWYYIGNIHENSMISWRERYRINDLALSDKYLASIYYVFLTLTTVGYGDIIPTNNTEKLFTVIMMFFGVFLYSFTVSSIITIISSNVSQELELKHKLSVIKELAFHSEFPLDLTKKIKDSLKQKSLFTHLIYNNILDEISKLSSNLRTELLEHIHRQITDGLFFFESKPQVFISGLAMKMSLQTYKLKDYLYEEYNIADEVYFLKAGYVKMTCDCVTFRLYTSGSYFGEVEVLENIERESNAQVSSRAAEIFIVGKKDFLGIFEEFPEYYEDVLRVAKIRKKAHEYYKIEALSNASDCQSSRPLFTIRNDSLSSEISVVPDDKLYRTDTPMSVSLKFDHESKRRNRKLWSNALGKKLEFSDEVEEKKPRRSMIELRRSRDYLLDVPATPRKSLIDFRFDNDDNAEVLENSIHSTYDKKKLSLFDYNNHHKSFSEISFYVTYDDVVKNENENEDEDANKNELHNEDSNNSDEELMERKSRLKTINITDLCEDEVYDQIDSFTIEESKTSSIIGENIENAIDNQLIFSEPKTPRKEGKFIKMIRKKVNIIEHSQDEPINIIIKADITIKKLDSAICDAHTIILKNCETSKNLDKMIEVLKNRLNL